MRISSVFNWISMWTRLLIIAMMIPSSWIIPTWSIKDKDYCNFLFADSLTADEVSNPGQIFVLTFSPGLCSAIALPPSQLDCPSVWWEEDCPLLCRPVQAFGGPDCLPEEVSWVPRSQQLGRPFAASPSTQEEEAIEWARTRPCYWWGESWGGGGRRGDRSNMIVVKIISIRWQELWGRWRRVWERSFLLPSATLSSLSQRRTSCWRRARRGKEPLPGKLFWGVFKTRWCTTKEAWGILTSASLSSCLSKLMLRENHLNI